MGLRPGSNAAVLMTFLILLFTIVGISLAVAGFDIGDVERWVDAQGGWLDAVGTFLFKVLLALILMICALVVWAAFFDRTNPQRPGVVGVIVAPSPTAMGVASALGADASNWSGRTAASNMPRGWPCT